MNDIFFIITLLLSSVTGTYLGKIYYNVFGGRTWLFPALDFKPFNCLLCSTFWISQIINFITILFAGYYIPFDLKAYHFIIGILFPFIFSTLILLADQK